MTLVDAGEARLAYADAFGAGLAVAEGAELWTGDPELPPRATALAFWTSPPIVGLASTPVMRVPMM